MFVEGVEVIGEADHWSFHWKLCSCCRSLEFLRLAEEHGYKTKFLGPAVSIDYLLDAVAEADPDMVAVSYRLTPETGYNIVARLKDAVLERGLDSYSYIFGGTVPVANKVKELDFSAGFLMVKRK